jgi:hypothetical protein
MAEAKLTIDIDVDGVAKAVTGLASVNRAVRNIDSRTNGLATTARGAGQTIQTSVNKWKKSFDQFDKMVKMVGTVGLKGLSMALKFATFEMAAMGAAMLAVHGAFILGNAAMKAMKATLGPLAAGMTGIVAAAAAASAAIREQQAAMWAYKNNSAPQFGSGLNQARMVMRALHTDVELSTVGIENLNKAYGTISKSSTFTAQSQNLLKGLMDFASAGQPIEEGITKAAELVALLQDSKKSFSEAKSSAEQLFPDKKAVQKAMKDLKINTKEGLQKAITSGELAKAAGVEGQFDAVSGTLMNRVKGYFTILRNQLGDLGQPLLEPIKEAANSIFNILRRGFVKISGNTQKFGMGSMLEGLVNMVDKLTTWSTDLINENISSVEGMFEKMAGWWKDFRYGWNETLDKLRPFIDGARVIEKAFGEVWRHVKDIVGSGFGQFNEWLQQNEETVVEFGGKIGDLFTSIMKFQMEMKKIIQDLMPFINNVIGGVSQMVDQMTSFIKALRSITGGGVIGALASLLAIRGAFGAMKNTKGGWMAKQTITTQPINAQQVVINTPSVVPGGGRLGTTGAAMRNGVPAGPGGLASATPRYGLASSGFGPTNYPQYYAHGGPGGLGGTRGAPLPGPAIPMVGQPGYQPSLIHGPQRTRGRRAAVGAYNRFRNFSYNTFTMPAESDEMYQQRRATETRIDRHGNEVYTRSAKFRQRQAAQRAARSGPFMSKGYKALGQFQGSQGVKMGTGLALGAMSQFAPAEAQGALALGGMVGMMNPLAGIGVAGLGTAMKSKTTTGGMLSGAAGGAAMGAMVGSIIPGLGTAAGAAAGALIGAVGGGIMGSINKNKEQVKAAREAASNAGQSIINGVLSGVLDGVRKESGTKGRTVLRDALPNIRAKQESALSIINQAPEKRGNYFGIMPDALDRGATGGQIGLVMENYTKKRMPGILRKAIGAATMSMDIAGNLAYGTVSKLGMKSLTDNRVLNPLGYSTNNLKDVDKRKQEEALRTLYRKQDSLGMKISEKELQEMMKKPGDALKKMRKDMENNEKAMGPIQDSYNARMDKLGKITGKSDREINDLAKSMGVNLMDNTKEFTEVLKDLGLATVKTVQQLQSALTNVYVDALSEFDKAIKALQTPQILDESAEAFRRLYDAQGGSVTKEQELQYVSDFFEQTLTYFEGDPMKAYAQTIESLQKNGTAFTDPRSPLYGMQNMDLLGSDVTKGVLERMTSGFGAEYGGRLNSMLMQSGVSVNQEDFNARWQAMTMDQRMTAASAITGGIGTGKDRQMAINKYGSESAALLAVAGLTDLTTSAVETPGTEAKDLAEVSEEIATATTRLIDQMSEYFKVADNAVPSWYNTPPSWWDPKDTSTPRGQAFGDTTSSRLSQTMARHASMNSMLTGTRTVTSGYRNYGLGSINSDHVTGRAYDLVGQNLGQYQSLVRGTGGFAEFHGVNGARHLHVVPGSGAIGDSRVPVSSSTTPGPIVMSGGGGGGNNYNFYVSGNQNASAGEIAEIVMQKVKEVERSNRERR